MIDIQHDSPTPIHEQIITQLMAHIAAGTLKAGTRLADFRAFAQQLLTNPQVTARAYAELEADGVLHKHKAGGVEIVAGSDVFCRARLHDLARQRLRQTVRQGLECGLSEMEVREAVEQALATPPPPPLDPQQVSTSIKKPSHAISHTDSQGIQDLSRQKGFGSP